MGCQQEILWATAVLRALYVISGDEFFQPITWW